MTDLLTVMQQLYSGGINSGIQAAAGGGFDVWLGDAVNGYDSVKNFCPERVSEAAQWLHAEACSIYHDSEYARHQNANAIHWCYWGRPIRGL